MAMVNKAGTEFSTGASAVVTEDIANITQSGSKKSSGQIRVFRNEEGAVAAVYKVDAGSKQITFEGLLEASASLPKKGDDIEIDGETYYVESAELIYKNDDAQRVRVTANLYADLAE